MNAEILSIGTELLLGHVIDTNAAHIARSLAGLGIGVYYKTVVGDNKIRIVNALRVALDRADVVISTGGLGPTMDDLTMECVAEVCDIELASDASVESDIRAFFDRIGRSMPLTNLKQARLPVGATVIHNEVGTAPGIVVQRGTKTIMCMPGVPSEMQWMTEAAVIPYLRARTSDGGMLVSRVLKIFGIGESRVEEMVMDILEEQTNPTIAPLASALEVKLRITAMANSAEEAEGLIGPVEARLRARLGSTVFGLDSETMEEVVGSLLSARGWRVATAESCTGGLVVERLTNVAGSSEYVDRSYITYSNRAKADLLAVSADMLAARGAVSREVAIAMAEGARRGAGVEVALGVTGIAGPGGGTPEKPVGLVYIALACPDGTRCAEHRFIGDRSHIRLRASQTALDMVRLYLLGSLGREGHAGGRMLP